MVESNKLFDHSNPMICFDKSVQDLSRQLRANLWSILMVELEKLVEYEFCIYKSLVSHRNPGTNMCVWMHMCTRFLQYPTPSAPPHPPPPQPHVPHAPSHPPPYHVGLVGCGEALGDGALEEHRVNQL